MIELVSKLRASIILKNAGEYKKRSGSNTRGDINLDTLHDENTTSNLIILSVSENTSAQQGKNKKHSVAVNSEVRTLTEDQQAYFANSKIRDKHGRLN